MPAIDEDIVTNLMHRAVSDLHASPAVTTRVVAGARQKTARTRALAATAGGVAAFTAIGVAVAAGGTGQTTTGSGHQLVIRQAKASSAVRTLKHLSLAAAITTQPTERYVEMSELQGSDKRTSVIDSLNGDIWTYQQGKGIPTELPVDRNGSVTEAQLNAYPTALPALRALLIKQDRQEQTIGLRAMAAQLAKDHVKDWRQRVRVMYASQPKESPDDQVFSQAAYLLWNPLVGPALRSALFKVLASTPGVVVNSHAKDDIGRPAVEISRYDKAANYTNAVFEAPDASAVLETASLHPATKANGGLPAEAAYSLSDVYLKTTWTNALPKNPYVS